MIDNRFEEGDEVPADYRTNDDDSALFAVSVEVYGGYGGDRHVYPEERVAEESSLFDGDVELADHVKVYTVPYDELR